MDTTLDSPDMDTTDDSPVDLCKLSIDELLSQLEVYNTLYNDIMDELDEINIVPEIYLSDLKNIKQNINKLLNILNPYMNRFDFSTRYKIKQYSKNIRNDYSDGEPSRKKVKN